MKLRFIVMCLTACLLGGCTDDDWDHALSYAGIGDSRPAEPPVTATADATPPAPPAAAAETNEAWCKEAAGYERDNAAQQGFDAATQQHLYDTRYRQCMQSSDAAVR